MSVLLGYWKLRGLCQPIRYLLEYTGTDWEEKYYFPGPAPNYFETEWKKEKFNLGLDFPNLPYLVDGDRKLTESKAIVRYIARKHDLVGKTEDERIRIDIVDGAMEDVRRTFATLCFNPNFENLKADYLAGLPSKLKLFSDYLGSNDWFAGKNLSWIDFTMYELLAQLKMLAPREIGQFAKIEQFMTRFEKLPKIAAYLSSPNFIKTPIFFVTAKFNGQ